jgi:hypothetical protein
MAMQTIQSKQLIDPAVTCRSAFARLRWMAENIRSQKASLIPSTTRLPKEWECSSKTIHRDLDLLRNFLDYPIVYDETHYGWKVVGPLPEAVLQGMSSKFLKIPSLLRDEEIGDVLATFLAAAYRPNEHASRASASSATWNENTWKDFILTKANGANK